MKKNIIPTAIASILAIFLVSLISCDNSYGIFSSIQKETKLTGTNVFLNGTVKYVVGDGTAYFAAMAKIYKRLVTDEVGKDKWKVIGKDSFPGIGPDIDYICTGLAEGAVGGIETVFAVLADSVTGELLGVYSKAAGSEAWTLSVAPASSGISSGSYIQTVFHLNGTLFASLRRKVTGSSDVYDLKYLSGSGFLSAGAAVTSVANPFTGGVWDGTKYRFAEAAGAYSGSASDAMANDSPTGFVYNSSTSKLAGICADSSGDVYISTSTGYVYRRLAADGSWSSKLMQSGVALGNLIVIPKTLNPGSTGVRLAIARYDSVYGYMEYDWDASLYYAGAAGKLASTESIYSTTLSGKPTLTFYLSPESRLFVTDIASNLTGYGMYSDAWSGSSSSWGGWVAE
jgi:hypothetical protein